MNTAKRKLINNIMTMPDDFSEEAIVLQLVLKEPPAVYGSVERIEVSVPECNETQA